MSQENVEIVRAGFEAFNAGEPDFSIYHPTLVYHPRADEPDPSPHIGREAFERLAHGFLESFSDLEFEVEELRSECLTTLPRFAGGGVSVTSAPLTLPRPWITVEAITRSPASISGQFD